MIAEGVVALIWAAAAIAFTGGYSQLQEYMTTHTAGELVHDVSVEWLGTFGGILALLGVVAAPITTGDTALRSAGLIVADFMHIDQSKFLKRMVITIPIFVLTFALMMLDFNVLWRYFAWTNQLLAAFTLRASTVYLARHGRAYVITLVPALFMTSVVVTYLFTAPSPEGFGLSLNKASLIAVLTDIVCLGLFIRYKILLAKGKVIDDVAY